MADNVGSSGEGQESQSTIGQPNMTNIENLMAEINNLKIQVGIQQALADIKASATATTSRRSRANDPDSYSGADTDAGKRSEKFMTWQQKIRIRWAQDAGDFSTEKAKILYAGSLLEGGAYQSVASQLDAVMRTDNPLQWPTQTAEGMLQVLAARYHTVNIKVRSENEWRELSQSGKYKSYADFITRYMELSDRIDLDDAARVRRLKTKVHKPLREALRVQRELPADDNWDKWLELMNELASNEEALNFEENYRHNTNNSKGQDAGGAQRDTGGPMELDAMSTKKDKERHYRFEKGLCLTCGKSGHFARDHGPDGRYTGNNNGNAANNNNNPGSGGGHGGQRGGYNGNQGGGRGWNDHGGWNGQQDFQYGNNFGLGQNGQNQQNYQRGGGYQRSNHRGQGGRGGPLGRQDLRAFGAFDNSSMHTGGFGNSNYGYGDQSGGRMGFSTAGGGRIVGEFDDHGSFQGYGDDQSQGNGNPSH
ncbi:hypothetical protein V8F06_013444 [Rhypophila decipiens]